jgi:hypothetical protein
MAEVTPERQALCALGRNLPRGDLPVVAQLDDWLRPAWERGRPGPLPGSWSTRVSSGAGGPSPGLAVRLDP